MEIPVYTAQQCHDLLREHGTPLPNLQKGFYELHTPLHVFKSCWSHQPSDAHVRQKVIVNLVIPEGAHVYHQPGRTEAAIDMTNTSGLAMRKMRADKAIVHSVFMPHPESRLNGSQRLEFSCAPTTKRSAVVGPLRYHPGPRGSGGAVTYITHGAQQMRHAFSRWDGDFVYMPGQTVVPALHFYDSRAFYAAKTCHVGVHFFMNLIDALVY